MQKRKKKEGRKDESKCSITFSYKALRNADNIQLGLHRQVHRQNEFILSFTDKMSSFLVKMLTDTRHDTATQTELLNTMMEWDGRWHTTLMHITSPSDDSDRQTQQNVANP